MNEKIQNKTKYLAICINKFIFIMTLIIVSCGTPRAPQTSSLYYNAVPYKPTQQVDVFWSTPAREFLEIGEIEASVEDYETDFIGLPITVSGGDPLESLIIKAEKMGADAIIISKELPQTTLDPANQLIYHDPIIRKYNSDNYEAKSIKNRSTFRKMAAKAIKYKLSDETSTKIKYNSSDLFFIDSSGSIQQKTIPSNLLPKSISP